MPKNFAIYFALIFPVISVHDTFLIKRPKFVKNLFTVQSIYSKTAPQNSNNRRLGFVTPIRIDCYEATRTNQFY